MHEYLCDNLEGKQGRAPTAPIQQAHWWSWVVPLVANTALTIITCLANNNLMSWTPNTVLYRVQTVAWGYGNIKVYFYFEWQAYWMISNRCRCHNVSKNNIRVLSREQDCQDVKSRRPSTSSNRAPPWIVIRDTNCPPSTPRSFRRYLGQVTDNLCVIRIGRRRSKRRIVSKNSFESKFKFTINVGPMYS